MKITCFFRDGMQIVHTFPNEAKARNSVIQWDAWGYSETNLLTIKFGDYGNADPFQYRVPYVVINPR